MLLTRSIHRNGFSKILFCSSASSIIKKHLIQQVNLQYQRNLLGYFVSYHGRFFNKNNDVINCKVITKFCTDNNKGYPINKELTPVLFEKVAGETLESLTEYFDELIEQAAHLIDADVSYGDGVLTVKFGGAYGTYVINRQTPNKQIWLSSPKSGPKRYDFVNCKWIYKHDGKTLHELLNNEIPAIIRNQTCFDKCSFSGNEKEAALNSLYH